MYKCLQIWFERIRVPALFRGFVLYTAVLWLLYSIGLSLLLLVGYLLGIVKELPPAEQWFTVLFRYLPIVVALEAGIETAREVKFINRFLTTMMYAYFAASAFFIIFSIIAFSLNNPTLTELSKKIFNALFGFALEKK